MPGFTFTEPLRAALAEARQTATSTGAAWVEPRHLLAVLLRDPEGVGTELLRAAGVDPAAPARALVAPPAAAWTDVDPAEVRFTTPAKRALERAMAEARGQPGLEVGPGHLLLGIAQLAPERRGLARLLPWLGRPDPAARALVASGATPERLRAALPGAAGPRGAGTGAPTA